jgi:hypothetical protein
MNSRVKLIGRSVLSLVATLAIGGGITYALFTSNSVTVTQSKLTTGTANLRICDSSASTPAGTNTWQDSFSSKIDFTGLTPSTTGVDITPNQKIYLGNDDGSLQDAIDNVLCNSYKSGVTPGNSNITLKMVPTISSLVCTDPALKDAMELGFIYGASSPTYQSLNYWTTNDTASGTFAAGEAKTLQLKARLDPNYTNQNQNCTFDTTFVGQQ